MNYSHNLGLCKGHFIYVKWITGSLGQGALKSKRAVWIPEPMGKTFGDPTFICAIMLAPGWK